MARNLSDEEIDLIGSKGGVVHIAAFTAYLLDLSGEQLKADIRALRLGAGIDERYTYPYELYWEIDDPEAQSAFLTSMRDLLGSGNGGSYGRPRRLPGRAHRGSTTLAWGTTSTTVEVSRTSSMPAKR